MRAGNARWLLMFDFKKGYYMNSRVIITLSVLIIFLSSFDTRTMLRRLNANVVGSGVRGAVASGYMSTHVAGWQVFQHSKTFQKVIGAQVFDGDVLDHKLVGYSIIQSVTPSGGGSPLLKLGDFNMNRAAAAYDAVHEQYQDAQMQNAMAQKNHTYNTNNDAVASLDRYFNNVDIEATAPVPEKALQAQGLVRLHSESFRRLGVVDRSFEDGLINDMAQDPDMEQRIRRAGNMFETPLINERAQDLELELRLKKIVTTIKAKKSKDLDQVAAYKAELAHEVYQSYKKLIVQQQLLRAHVNHQEVERVVLIAQRYYEEKQQELDDVNQHEDIIRARVESSL